MNKKNIKIIENNLSKEKLIILEEIENILKNYFKKNNCNIIIKNKEKFSKIYNKIFMNKKDNEEDINIMKKNKELYFENKKLLNKIISENYKKNIIELEKILEKNNNDNILINIINQMNNKIEINKEVNKNNLLKEIINYKNERNSSR